MPPVVTSRNDRRYQKNGIRLRLVVLAAVLVDGSALHFAPLESRSDEEIVETAVEVDRGKL